MRSCFQCAARQGGFTLVEILIAMTLLGFIMLTLFGGLRLGGRVWETGDARAAARAGTELVQGLLRRTLAGARPLVRTGRDANRRIAFVGRTDRVEFVAVLPRRFGAGEFQHVIFAIEEDGAGSRLVFRYAPLDEETSQTVLGGADEAEPTVLIAGLGGARFAYYGTPEQGGAPGWRDDWTSGYAAPALVRLEARSVGDGRSWPTFIVALPSRRPARPTGVSETGELP